MTHRSSRASVCSLISQLILILPKRAIDKLIEYTELKQRKNLVFLSTVSSRHFVYRIGYTSVNFQKKWQDAFFIKTRLRLGESSTKRWENIQRDQSLRGVEQKILKAFRVTEATTNANILAGAS